MQCARIRGIECQRPTQVGARRAADLAGIELFGTRQPSVFLAGQRHLDDAEIAAIGFRQILLCAHLLQCRVGLGEFAGGELELRLHEQRARVVGLDRQHFGGELLAACRMRIAAHRQLRHAGLVGIFTERYRSGRAGIRHVRAVGPQSHGSLDVAEIFINLLVAGGLPVARAERLGKSGVLVAARHQPVHVTRQGRIQHAVDEQQVHQPPALRLIQRHAFGATVEFRIGGRQTQYLCHRYPAVRKPARLLGHVLSDCYPVSAVDGSGRQLRDALPVPVRQARQSPARKQPQCPVGIERSAGAGPMFAGEHQVIIERRGAEVRSALGVPDRIKRRELGTRQDIHGSRR